MVSWVLIIVSASISYQCMDLGSSDYMLSKICPAIFTVSIILALFKLVSSNGTSSPGDGGGGSSSSWGGGGDCGGGDGGC